MAEPESTQATETRLDREDAEIISPQRMLNEFEEVNICAPMVRYSKLPFRHLVSEYETHMTFTPMILAQEFCLSEKARDSDFSTNADERGVFLMRESPPGVSPPRTRKVRGCLIAQFGGHSPLYMGHAAALVKNYVDGVDINCGCPQQWAYKEGIGSALLRKWIARLGSRLGPLHQSYLWRRLPRLDQDSDR